MAAFPLDDDRWLVLAIDRKGFLPDGDMIVPDAEQAKARIERLIADTGADELIVVTDTYEHADRLQSCQRVAAIASTIEVAPSVHAGA